MKASERQKENQRGRKTKGYHKEKTKGSPKENHRTTIENHWKIRGKPSEQQKEYIRKTPGGPKEN